MQLIFILISLPALFVIINFLGFLFFGKHIIGKFLLRLVEICSMIILPSIYGGFGEKNNCCGDSAVFSPNHQLTIGVIILLCLIAYFYSSYRKEIATPIVEVIVNCLLITGIVLNIFIAIQTDELLLAVLGNLPIVLLAILALVKNQRSLIDYTKNFELNKNRKLDRVAWKILNLQPIVKFPIIFICCLPVLLIITSLLLLVGQRPDSIIRAFTDTYKHGFSQWDYKCDNIACGGHYLCSVAANGHEDIVKPQRLGMRNGQNIICNRQLLISNAFEELIQERLPSIHNLIRKEYNKVGDIIHRYYDVFNNKFFSDLIYVLMKPLEIFFLLILYTFDKKPENRIAKQYLSDNDRKLIDRY